MALLMALAALSGCNHVFYYPMRDIVATPADHSLAYESFTSLGPRGVDLAIWWIKAAANVPQRGIVVQFHGNAENISTHFLYVAWLTRYGYDVLSFDYRGYGMSTSLSPTQEGLVDDGCQILNWIANQAPLRGRPLFVIGQSLGGAVALPTLARCPPPQLKALVIDSSFASYRELTRMRLSEMYLTWPLQVPLSWLVHDEASPAEAIGRVRVPLLFLHSPEDPVVPYGQGRALYERAFPPKEFVDVEGGGHTAALAMKDARYRERLLRFFEDAARPQRIPSLPGRDGPSNKP